MNTGGPSEKRRACAFCGCNHGVDIHAWRLPALTLAPAKGHPPPPSGIWTVTEVTQKLCCLLYSARVQRRSTGTGPRAATGTGRGEANSRVEEEEGAMERASVTF